MTNSKERVIEDVGVTHEIALERAADDRSRERAESSLTTWIDGRLSHLLSDPTTDGSKKKI